MRRRLRKPCSGQPCILWRSRRPSRWICWLCIACARASSASVPVWINQIRGFLIERGITVRQGLMPLRKTLAKILSSDTGVLSPRMVGLVTDLVQDWRRLDERIAAVSAEIEALAEQDESCQRLMTVPGVGPIIECRGGGDRQWRRLQAGTRLRRLAGARAEAGLDRGSHHPGQDLQARQQVPEDAVRAGRARRPGAAAACGDAGFVALDRAGFEAAPPQHAGDRTRQQARPHRLGGSRPRSRLSAEDPRQCRVTKVRSGPPRGCPPPSAPPSLASPNERATVAPRGWLHMIPLTSNIRTETE